MHLFVIGADMDSTEPDAACSISSLDEDTLEDLKIQLQSNLTEIHERYTLYVSCIRESLQEKGVRAKDLCSDLMTMPAFSHPEQKLILLSAHKEKLEKAGEQDDLNAIFDLLASEYATFIAYDIFQFILEKYQKKYHGGIATGQEELKYPDHLKLYLKKHNASEFAEINPLLKKYSAASTELVLKMDIESTTSLSKIKRLKSHVAKILGLRSRTLRLLDIKDGCIIITFLLPTPVTELIFPLTEEQVVELKALSVLRLECNNRTLFNFMKAMGKDESETPVSRYVQNSNILQLNHASVRKT
jgi:hypothetical protein